jgi:hypothetical protein
MAKKIFGLGMLVMVLAFGMMVMGCAEEQDNGEFTILNNCDDYSITKIKIWGGSGTDITESVNLVKGQSKSYTLSNGDYKYTVEVTYTGEGPEPIIRNEEVLSNQSKLMQYGIDYKIGLQCSNGNPSQEPGSYFSWGYNL